MAQLLSRAPLTSLLIFAVLGDLVATQVPPDCGAHQSGTLGPGQDCKGYCVGSDAGFATQCGDSIMKGGVAKLLSRLRLKGTMPTEMGQLTTMKQRDCLLPWDLLDWRSI